MRSNLSGVRTANVRVITLLKIGLQPDVCVAAGDANMFHNDFRAGLHGSRCAMSDFGTPEPVAVHHARV